MALSRDGIAKVRSISGEISTLSTNLKNASDDLQQLLQKNGNYQYFKAGTDKGASVDSDLNQAVSTIIDKLVPQLSSISGVIESFCVRQERENQREIQEMKEKMNQVGSRPFDNIMRPF